MMKCACEKCECNDTGYCYACEIELDENGVCASMVYRLEVADVIG